MRKFVQGLAAVFLIAITGLFAWGYAGDIPVAVLKAKYANAESEFVDLGDGMTVHLRDEGPIDAPAIILLHGSSSSLHTWDAWTQLFQGKYRVIRYDQAGHGLTGPHPKDCYTGACFADVVNRIADNRGLKRFVLAGNSMGGWVAWEYAKAHAERLDGLILVDASGAPDSAPKALPIGFRLMAMPGINRLATFITPRSFVEKSLHQTVSKAQFITDKEIDLYWELLRRPGNRDATIKRNTARIAMAAQKNDAPVLRVPSLILWGAEDKLIPVKAAKWFETKLQNHETHIYAGTGHLPMQEVAEQSAADVLTWMERTDKKGT